MTPPQEPVTVRLDDEFHAWTGTATPEVVSLIGRMFAEQGETRSAELLAWQYLSHLGGAHVCIAHTKAGLHEGPAALYAAFPTPFQVDGRAVTAYQSFDTLTVAAFRGRGLFVRLAELAFRQLADSGAGLVYGIPNGESFGGFVITALAEDEWLLEGESRFGGDAWKVLRTLESRRDIEEAGNARLIGAEAADAEDGGSIGVAP